MNYSLTVQGPILVETGFTANLTHRALDWKRSIRSMGGYWLGKFTLEGSIGELATPFHNWLGHHVEERSGGGISWEGLIYEMDLIHGGIKRRRSLDMLYNRVKVTYRDPNNEDKSTTWGGQGQSQNRYGQRDLIERGDYMTPPGAEALRNRLLAEYAWPWARPVSIQGSKNLAALTVVVCGYIFTANWRYCTQTTESDSQQGSLTYAATTFTDAGQDWTDWETTSGDAQYSIWITNSDGTLTWAYLGAKVSATQINVYTDQARASGGWNGAGRTDKAAAAYYVRGSSSALISDVVGSDCEYLTLGKADPNLLQVNRISSSEVRAFDVMEAAADLGGTSGEPWRIYTKPGRLVTYEAIEPAPRYYWRAGALYDDSGFRQQPNPWRVQPAVMRDLSYIAPGGGQYESWLDDQRDVYLEEITVDADGRITPKTRFYSEGEALAEQTLYFARMPRAERPR